MADSNKEHFIAVLTAAESKGLLPKGKTADILENYDFLVDEIDAQTKLLADEPVPFTRESDADKTFDPDASPASLGSFGVLTGTLSVDRPTIPEGDSSESQTFVKGKGKKAPPPDAA